MKKVALVLIRGYQRFISPVLPPSCVYQPTCSHYGYEAIETHGIVKGVALTAWRILRCNPFSKGGFDPVPEHLTFFQLLKRKRHEQEIIEH